MNPERRMPLSGHVRELRRRVLLVAGGLVVGTVIGWYVYPWVFATLEAPIAAAGDGRGGPTVLNFAGIGTSFDMRFRLAFFVGVLGTSPWWLYQIWAFITPGLRRRERRYTLGFLGVAVPLFLIGAWLAWRAIPQIVGFLTSFTPAGATNIIDVQTYLGFVTRMTLAFGLVFLVPVVMVALTMAGVTGGRFWLKGWRWAVFLSFLFSAMASPTPDILTMFTLALPVCVLYFAAVGLCLLHDRRGLRVVVGESEESGSTV